MSYHLCIAAGMVMVALGWSERLSRIKRIEDLLVSVDDVLELHATVDRLLQCW